MKFVIIKTTVGDLEDQQIHLAEYLEYLKALRARQVLLSAGGFSDRSGGVLLVEVPGLEEAIAVAREDPLVREGVSTYAVHGWQPWVPEAPEGLDAGQLPLLDPSAPQPMKVPPPAESFKVVEATDESSYAEFLVTCFPHCAISPSDPMRCDYLRHATLRGLRKLLLLHDEEVVGELEFAPAGASGLPVEGEELAVIHCVAVLDAYTGLGGARLLLAACADLSEAQGLATIAYNASLPWLPRSFFEKHGFIVVDQAETGRYYGNEPIVAYLMWRPLKPEARRPSWNRAALHDGVEFCPRYPWLCGKRLYWGHEFDYHGVLVKEGLRRPELLQQLCCLGTHRADNWTLVKVGIPSVDLNHALDLIQSALVAEPCYYGYVYGGRQMCVVYPDRIFRVSPPVPGSPAWQEARRYGLDKGIPDAELVFEPCRFEDETF